MDLETLFHLIELQPEMIEKLEAAAQTLPPLPKSFPQSLLSRYAADAYSELKAALGDDSDSIRMLYCQLTAACYTWEEYRKKGIPEKIFIDTMKCFPRFIGECLEKTGNLAFDRGWWTWRQLSLSLFRIGALEYEFQTHKGEPVIELHIPSDGDLSKDAVDASFREAQKFFQTFYPEYPYEKYTCTSWLLSPALRELLPENSRILAFQSRFQDIKADLGDLGFLEWLFQAPETVRYEDLPEHTSLQKKAKVLLLSGGSIGASCGMIPRTF